jgi:hypothetical protein
VVEAPQYIELTLVADSKVRKKIEVPPELRVLEGNEEPSVGQFTFRIIDRLHGDKRLTWDSRSLREINAAKTMFVELIKEGLTPYKVGLNGKKTSEVMTEFDPSAEEVLFLPMQLVTGG